MKIHSPNQQHATVDTKFTPRESLLQYVDGSSWEVTYYSQVLGADSQPGPWDINRSPTDQQYVRITNMEIKVTSPLTSNEEQPGRSQEVVGTALMYPSIRPNVGDMFIADIGDGRAGLFAITEVNRKVYLQDSHAEIQYQLVNFVDSNPHIESNLNLKTIRRTVFYKDHLEFGQNPQLLEGEFNDLMKLKRLYGDLLNFYFKDFYSIQYHTLLIPDQNVPSYDPYVTGAMLDWVTADEVPMITQVRQPVVTANRNNEAYTLWSALARMNDSYLGAAIQQMRLLNTIAFRGMPEISSVYYTGIKQVACPLDARTDVDAPYDNAAACFSGGSLLQTTGLRWKDLFRYIPSSNLKGFFPVTPPEGTSNLSQLPDILPVTVDEFYVLSRRFYRPEADGVMGSKLEVLTKQGLRQEPIDKVTLVRLAETAMNWPNLERFYYMPILFALMKVALRTN